MPTNQEHAYELAQMSAQSASQANFDAKKYICGPWLKGARGGPWQQVFKPAFEEALRKETDNFSSLYEHFVTQTAYGAANGIAHPGGAGLAAVGFQSNAAFRTRDQKGYGLILSHIGHETSVKERIETHVANVLMGSPDIPAVNAANAAIAVANAANAAAVAAAAAGGPAAVLVNVPAAAAGVVGQLPFDWLGQLYNWIDANLGQARASGLLTATQNSQFEDFKITDVGIHRDTMSQAYAALVRLNKQRTVPYGPMELWVKFLRQITFPKLLNDEALKELQAPTFLFAAGPNAGQPDLGSFVARAEELWHVIYDRGIEIKPQAAPKPITEPSNRVDGMGVFVMPQHEFAPPPGTNQISAKQALQYDWTGLTDAEIQEALFVTSRNSRGGTEGFAFLKDERNCWVCKGFGHTKDKCGSDPTVKRPYQACIQGLQMLKSNDESRLRNFRQRRIIKRPGKSPPVKAFQSAVDNDLEPLVQYDDGGIYTMSGEEVQAPPIAEQHAVNEAATASASPTAADTEQGTNAPVSEAKSSEPVSFHNIDSAIDRDFSSSMNLPSFNVETCSPSDGDGNDDFVYNKRLSSSTRSLFAGILVGVACGLGAAALAVRSAKGRALFTLLAMAAAGESSQVRNGGDVTVKVHSSQYSRFCCYDSYTKPDMHASDGGSRPHGTMDTGTTECTSGRRKLFPDSGIEQWHPRIQVEVASGVCLPVLFKGTMVMKVRPSRTTSTKKSIAIPVPHSLHVPKMPVTLVSTKALFRYCNICTYFNDELCMVLPTGEIVGFVETATNYTVVFDDDDDTLVTPVRHPNTHRWPWTQHNVTAEKVMVRSTLRQPLPLTWDLLHERLVHFSPERIWRSSEYISGLDIAPLGTPPRHNEPCIHCIRGAFRGHRRQVRPPGQYSRFGQRICSDSCTMPKSTPFGYIEMYIFYDMATKYIAVYYGKTTTSAEMLLVCKQFIADHLRWMPKNRVEEWFADGGPEFKSSDLEEFCTEMYTRRRFIAPWNPWMNVAETGWRIILRPLRIVLAANNVSTACWPFAVNQIVVIHNALSSSSDTAPSHESSFAVAFVASLLQHRSPPSPYFNVTGKPYDLSNLRVLFCEVEARIRSKHDWRKRAKPDPVTMRGINLGPSSRSHGALVYLFDVQRFTVASYNDIYYRENVRPRLDRIVGSFVYGERTGSLPSLEQQLTDTGGVNPPELALPVAEQTPATTGTGAVEPGQQSPARNRDHGDDESFRPGHCSTPGCEYNLNHDGPCSTIVDAAAHPRRPGLTLRDATRSRDTANVVAAVEGDTSNTLAAATDHKAFAVAVAGDGEEQVLVCYNTGAPDDSTGVEPPKTTSEALNGPYKQEWLAAYQKDLAAKVKNGTFTYVPRPNNTKVLRTKVAHVHHHKDDTDSTIITEFRARWVGMGFLQGPHDFNATYCATPSATSCRLFLNLVMRLNLHLAKSDVTKAFTLNPIDVELHVEQMPGMETAGDWKGATKENTVCLLHKCLEGLKQAGNVWQTTHSGFLDGLRLLRSLCTLVQSTIDPTLFIGHCSKGIIALLVWVDDLMIGFSCQSIYDEFVELYKRRFPSKHELGCNKFAGIAIEYKRGSSVTIHQRAHIEHAYNKFIIDKGAAAKSSFVSRPAIADRNSPLHYSKLTLAKNDTERNTMKTLPFLPALATLMYIVHFTNPHLNYLTSFLGQFMHDPSPECMDAVLGLIIYAYYHRNIDVITYGGEIMIPRVIPQHRRKDFLDSYGFHGYCDASWLLRSPAGLIVFLFNGPIDWCSKLIRVICHSSAEAEIAAGCMLGKRIVFVVQFAKEFKVDLKLPGMLLIDNTAADDLSNKFGVTPKTAHFLRWQFYLRWLVVHRWAEIVFVPTKEQLADILTKVVDFSTFVAACNILFKRRSMRTQY